MRIISLQGIVQSPGCRVSNRRLSSAVTVALLFLELLVRGSAWTSKSRLCTVVTGSARDFGCFSAPTGSPPPQRSHGSASLLRSPKSRVALAAESEANANKGGNGKDPFDFKVRDCKHAELGACADVIMSSFYNYTSMSPWRQLMKIKELDRIQQGFPYGDDRSLHRMLIVTASSSSSSSINGGRDETICGFVDIDARLPNRPTSYSYNPRPYLSDLCIHPDFRRKGLARALIKACEDFCVQLPKPEHLWSDQNSDNADLPELYIRVEATNAAAIDMYRSLGYNAIPNPGDQKILILHKVLAEKTLTPSRELQQEVSMTNATSRA